MPSSLIVFLKAPRPGLVKTRLTPFLTPAQAASLAEGLARDCLALAGRSLPDNGRLIVAYAPDDALPELTRLMPTGPTAPTPIFIRQQGADLGARMANAAGEAHALGLSPLILLGTDCPALSLGTIRRALELLVTAGDDGVDMVLGPAEDGGYYLLGIPGGVPTGLFNGVVWSTDTVFAQTAANAGRLGLRVHTDLPALPDIDSPGDLIRLRQDLMTDPVLRELAPATTLWFQDNRLPPLPGAAALSGEVEHR